MIFRSLVVLLLRQHEGCATVLTHDFDEQIHMINEAEGSLHPPTKAEITRGMRWLVDDAKAGDSLFLHIAGHGIQIKDRDGDEVCRLKDVLKVFAELTCRNNRTAG